MITKQERNLYVLLFSLIFFTYLYILPYDVMDIDSTQYAEISREMIVNQDYFFLKDNGRKYLDKPIVTFWIISLFYKIFGISNISFRLSALFFGILATFGIYKITFLLYKSQKKAILAALLFFSSPALFTMILNPLIDLYLIAIIIFTFYFYYLGIYKHTNYFYGMYLLIGLGFITKGPISLIIPVISIGGSIFLTRNWELLKKLHLFLGVIIVVIPVLFWSYILYLDFGFFGPYFFLYLQSFGRFFHKIYDTGFNPFYFYFTALYFILPFSIAFLIALRLEWNLVLKQNTFKEKIKFLYDLIYKKDIALYLWGFLILFLLSFSKFRLPQYVFWLIPPFCILAGNFIESHYDDLKNRRIHLLLFFLVILFLFGFYVYSKLSFSPLTLIYISVWIFLFLYLTDLFLVSLFSFVVGYSYIVSVAYPYLVSFQPSSKIYHKILEVDPITFSKQEFLFTHGISLSNKSYPLYAEKLTKEYFFKKEEFYKNLEKNKTIWIVIHQFFLEEFQKEVKEINKNIEIEIYGEFPTLKVSKPKIQYFHPQLKQKYIEKIYLVKLRYQ